MKDINKLNLSILAKVFLKNDNDVDKLLCYIVKNFKENGEEIINQFIDDNVIDLEQYGNKVFYLSCVNSYIGLIRFMLNNNRLSSQAEYDYAIKRASENGSVEVVKLLLEDCRTDPSSDDNYAIKRASGNGHVEVVKLLLADKRVDPSSDDNYAIRMALKNNHKKVTELLFKYFLS